MSRALVLAGGGIVGVAWELGVVVGLHDAGVDVRDADLVVGTSAGSVVGAQILSGVDLEELLASQSAPTREDVADLTPLMGKFAEILGSETEPVEILKRLGALAVAADTMSEEERLEIIAARLPKTEWPDGNLVVTAVDVETGEFVTFDRTSGVDLLHAVAASCAIPGLRPPTTINGRRYMDGGVRSGANADVADGYATMVITPSAEGSPLSGVMPADAVVIRPDEASLAAIGPNLLDPAARAGAAAAGKVLGASAADRVRAGWL